VGKVTFGYKSVKVISFKRKSRVRHRQRDTDNETWSKKPMCSPEPGNRPPTGPTAVADPMSRDTDLLRGALFIVASELMFASMGATVKAAALSGMPNEMLVFLRNLVGMLLIFPLLLHRGGPANLRTRVPHLHLLRATMGVAAMYCFFYALTHLALADGMLLKMTAPIFMPIIAWLWLNERATPLAMVAVALGFLGVALVLRPGGEFNWAALVGLAGGAFSAVAKVTVRRLSRTEPTARIVFYFALLGTFVSALPLAWGWQAPTPAQWPMVIAIGLLGTLGQILLTQGYAAATPARVGPFTYFSVVFGAAYGYLFWDERLEWYFVAGALLIAFAGMLALHGKRGTVAIDETLEPRRASPSA
jgi:drug/metabolite transporter (DMT)-like permease